MPRQTKGQRTAVRIWFWKQVDPAYDALFARAGEFLTASADALETLFHAERIDAAGFVLLDELEHKADIVTHDVLDRIEAGHRPRFPAPELRRLILQLDSIVDAAEAAGELALLCGVSHATTTAREMTVVLTKSTREVASLLKFLPDPPAGSSFRPYVVRAHELEHDGDDLWTRGFSSLFQGDVPPLDVIRWQAIYAQLEEAIDGCETAAKLVERLLVRASRGGPRSGD